MLLADRAFDADWLRENLDKSGIVPVIPPRSNRKFPPEFDKHCYKWRHLIENYFQKLKEFKGAYTLNLPKIGAASSPLAFQVEFAKRGIGGLDIREESSRRRVIAESW